MGLPRILRLGRLELRLAHVPREYGNQEQEHNAEVEWIQVVVYANILLVVAQLLLRSKAQEYGELLLLMRFMQAVNPVNIEHILTKHIDSLYAQDDLGLETKAALRCVVLHLDEEATHDHRQQNYEKDRGVAQQEDQLSEAQHEERDGLKDLVGEAGRLPEDTDVLELQQLVVTSLALEVFRVLLIKPLRILGNL